MPSGVYVRTEDHKAAIKKARNKPETILKLKKTNDLPEIKEKHRLALVEYNTRPDVVIKKSRDAKEAHARPDTKSKHKSALKIALSKPEELLRKSIASKEMHRRPEVKRKRSIIIRESKNRPDVIEKRVGGFWYGNVRNDGKNRYKYCELWNEDLKRRIRAFFGNISVISGKTKSDNDNRNMSCHHVYYQKKACCEWDEDAQGYYAMIDGEKYYIEGDPNKFVTLTNIENGVVEKDKLKWVKIFEDIIENRYNGKCYYTMDEFYDLGGVV